MSENQVVVLKTLDEVKTQLNMIRQNNLTDALQYSLQAQLDVVTSTESFDLGNHAFSAMLDSFKHALSAVADENERLELQKRNSLMIANLFFFSEAKIKFLEKKNSEEGKKLLQQGCELLVDTTGQLMKAVASRSGDILEHVAEAGATNNWSKLALDGIAIATSMAENFDTEKNKKFFVPAVGFVSDKARFKKLKDEFDEFMRNSVIKLYENKDLYYPTIQLTDYIRPYENVLKELRNKKIRFAVLLLSFAAFGMVFLFTTNEKNKKLTQLQLEWQVANPQYEELVSTQEANYKAELDAYKNKYAEWEKNRDEWILENSTANKKAKYPIEAPKEPKKPKDIKLPESATAVKKMEKSVSRWKSFSILYYIVIGIIALLKTVGFIFGKKSK